MKKCLSLLLALSLAVLPLTACGSASAASNGEVVVYNWGEYIDPETISMFEEETGIKVIYDEFETNEIMYPKIEAGASKYDVVCPSDYMIQKMIENDLLAELNYDNIPNAKKNIGEQYWNSQSSSIRRTNIPYLTAGEPLEFCTIRLWLTIPWTAGPFSGMKNIRIIS